MASAIGASPVTRDVPRVSKILETSLYVGDLDVAR